MFLCFSFGFHHLLDSVLLHVSLVVVRQVSVFVLFYNLGFHSDIAERNLHKAVNVLTT